ncbi:rho guanine nucleotide exchange factor 17 [Paroedura picta]|uniref:rho guanine nucleotide exchange factor 17 n=1 Tax=Paroedura picta TaxID=143630 RepID=UPI0040561E0E
MAAEGGSPLPRRRVSFHRPDGAPAQQRPQAVPRRAPGRAASFSACRPPAAAATPEPPPRSPPSGRRAVRSASPSVLQLSRRFCAAEAGPEPPGGKGPGEAPSDWPSVPAMRRLFGDSARRQPREKDGADGDGAGHDPSNASSSSCSSERGKSPPPPPPPRSCIPFRTHRLPRAHAERTTPLWTESHSSHSSPPQPAARSSPGPAAAAATAPAAAAAAAASPAGSPDGREGPPRAPGGEEEQDRVAPWRREAGADGLAGMEWHRKAQEELSGDLALLAEPRTRPFFGAKRPAGDSAPAVALPGEARLLGGVEGHRPFARGLSEGGGAPPGAPVPLSSASPLPLVSRVSKVNIPPFVPSPCGSRSSSRYSSTETLKEEDHFGTSWASPSRAFQGVFRSPSFSQSESLARLQAQVRARPKLPSGIVRTKAELPACEALQRCGGEASEEPRHVKSMSNPDIAAETLTLLSFLKSDLLDLKTRRKNVRSSDREEAAPSGGGGSRYESDHAAGAGRNPAGATQSEGPSSTRWAMGNRPTLKDLTATLRRAKSFTYSDKPPPRRLFYQSAMKQSSSELLLATCRDHEGAFSDSEIGRDVDDGAPVVIQDQYIQEARQVFEKISKIGAQNDYNFGLDPRESGDLRGGREGEKPLGKPEGTRERSLGKTGSEGDDSSEKSLEELSGRESSMTDEGIVTEPETCSAYRYLDPSVVAWRAANQRENEAGLAELKGMCLPSPGSKANQETDDEVDEALPTRVPQGLTEPPSTPGVLRRRRKFPSVGNGGSESSNGSNGESNGETYRSLSDPMPHRKRSITEDSKNFSVDSNFLGSLNSKSGIPESSAVALSECAGSAASDLSVCSDGVEDYRTEIQDIVSQPGAMDRVIDEKGNGKTIKKKSFSDPSRRSEFAGAGFDGPGEPISEMDQVIPPSSSEPILSERDPAMGKDQDATKRCSQSERLLTASPEGDMLEAAMNYGFDPKLAEVLSPRIVRRTSKKRTNRVNGQESRKDEAAPYATAAVPTPLGTARPASKHVRHTSEPATFVPLSEVNLPASFALTAHAAPPESSRLPAKPYPVLQAPSLEDVTKHYMLTLRSGEPSPTNSVDMPRSSPVTPTTSEPRLPRCLKHHEEPSAKSKPQVDMRKHVTLTLLDTENSYVESLRTLMQGYMKPLKQPENSVLCDPSLVDEIFDQIPELLQHHEEFLEQISECVQNWHEKQKVGDILVQSFSKEILVNIYSAYIDNFLNAKDAVRIAKEARPAFMKFLEQSMRENKEKQALSDLMIKPVQRIPRYELLVKDLLKHTPEEHPDHPFLMEAQRSIKQVAERINKGMKSAEEVERNARIVQEIESHIEGMEDLQAPLRKFLRQEMVVELKAVGGKKDRSLFLFTDLLVCTTLKRKSGSLRRSSMSLYTAASVIDTTSKYKLIWKMPLEDVDIVKGASQSTNRESIQKTICRLDEDLSTLGQVGKLSETLSFPHQTLDDVIKDLMASIHRELAEKQSLSFTMSFPPNKMELTVSKADGNESYIFEFPNPDARQSFEQAFEDTKKKLASNKNCLDPEFLKAIPIMKTRSGMQFSCASPSHSTPENAYEVWVCNSDGYVGQVCLLSIRREPIVEACIAVCSARILCIASVPGLKRTFRERPESLTSPSSEPAQATPDEVGPQQCLLISISGSSLELSEPVDSASRELVPFDSDDTDDESSPSPSGTLQSQASRSTISSSFGNEEIPSSKDVTAETTSSEEEQDPSAFLPIASTFVQNRNGESPMDGQAMRRSSRGSFTRGSLEDLLSIDPEAYQSSMWLGTEDGCIHVYQSSDNIRNRKNSMKMQHGASVTCILYLDNQVFVSLANGELIAYQREAGRFWDSQNSKSLALGSPGSPVTKMVAVASKLWCGCQNRVVILSTATLQQEHSFHVGQDSSRGVTCLVSSIVGVWVTLQGSAQVRLYHPASYEQLAEVDITPPVHKMLAGSDAIIRQHKAACLRITALLACKDLLWIGTSAGVVLTLPITANSAASLKTPPLPVGLSQGHTGHVRFLTAIELPEGFDVLFPLPRDTGLEKPSDLEKRDSTRHRPPKSKMLVISGGDGYEDFRLTNSSETVGRDDSTNHLLLWRV